MKIVANCLDEKLRRIITEVGEIPAIREARGRECEIEAVQAEQVGFCIEKTAPSRVKVTYGSVPALCRAMLHIAAASDADAVDGVSHKCCFTDMGIMVDCSRNGVLNMDAAKDLIRYAAFMGYTFIGLYTEDTFEVDNEPYFGYMRGRYTKAEIRELVAYGEIFGIELRPFIQTLAHLNQITRYSCYQEIVDTNDILLIDDERTYELIENMIKSAAESYKSRKINIGMDEAAMVGLGKFRKLHGECDRNEIMIRHLSRVLDICRKYGFEAEMWSDMFFRLASGGSYYADGELDLTAVNIPDDITLCYWDYYSTDPKVYHNMMKQHKKMTDRLSFAGGAWKWEGFAPYNRFSIEVGKLAIDACKANGVDAFTVTCWGDDGAECAMFSVLPTLFADASLAYGEELDKESFAALTGIGFDDFMLVDRVNPGVGEDLTQNTMCKNLLYNDPLIGTFDNFVRGDTGSNYSDVAAGLLALSDNLKFGYLFESLGKLCRVLELKADLGVRLKDAYDRKDTAALSAISKETLPELIRRLEEFYASFRTQWMKENKAFGFEIQSVRLGGLERRLKDTLQTLNEYLAGERKSIDELEEERLPFAYRGEGFDLEHTMFNRWAESASPSRLTF